MAEKSISKADLKDEIKTVLKGADLTKLSAKAVRKSLEDALRIDLTDRKQEIDEILMDIISQNAKQEEEELESAEESNDEKDDEALAKRLQEEESLPRRSAFIKASSKKKAAPKQKKEGAKRSNSAYSRPCHLSEDLAEVVGAKEMPRHSVVKKMWEIARERKLFDPSNKRYIICDDQLYKMFGTKRILMFGIMKHLKTHIKDQKNLAK